MFATPAPLERHVGRAHLDGDNALRRRSVTSRRARATRRTPDASWSAYQPASSGAYRRAPGALHPVPGTLTESDKTATPSLEKVAIALRRRHQHPATGGGPSGGSGGGGGGGSSSGGNSYVDKTAPKVTFVAKSLRRPKKGTVSFTVGCPATEKSCKVKVSLKNGTKTVASKTVTIKGGKTKTVTLTAEHGHQEAAAKRHSLKLSRVVSATDAAGNTKTTSKKVTPHSTSATPGSGRGGNAAAPPDPP